MRKELIVVPSWKYNETVLDLVKRVSDKHKKVCYVTLNKTQRAVAESLRKRGMKTEKFIFVDTISPKVFKMSPKKECLFMDSIENLDAFTDKLLTFIKVNKANAVFFDSLSSFLVYHTDDELVKFFNYLVSFLEALDVSIMMTVILEDVERPSVKQIKMNVDASDIEMNERAASLLKW